VAENQKNEGKKTLLWDEANLEETSKGRGTRQKINEPDTPYHYPGDFSISESGEEESEDSLKWDQLQTKLEAEKQKQEQGIDLVTDQQKKEEKRKEFLQKRKSHYNEAKKWKEMENSKETANQVKKVPKPKEKSQEPEKNNNEPPKKKRKINLI